MADAHPETPALPLWIKALALLGLLVALANGAMVWLALKGNRDLVRKDYYQAGLDQDGRMARRALAAGFSIRLDLAAEGWSLAAAPSTAGAEAAAMLAGARCRVRLRRPDDGRRDRVVDLVRGADGVWRGPGTDLVRGRYDVTVEWERDGRVFMETAFARWIDG